jgi:choline-glycine betaine transporter
VFKNPLLLIALTLTGLIAIWGIVDTAGLAQFSSTLTGVLFTSRGWFVMLSVSLLLILCIWLAISPYGKIKLGKDNDEPEFSTVSWLTMLFAAGMGVGLLFWGTAEPLSHYKVVRDYTDQFRAAEHALFITNFHWGLHAWAIYAVTFFVLGYLPLSTLTIIATILAAFLFVVTSVVSASFVLSMFSMGGELNPPIRTKLMWGVILGALGLVMILSNSIDAVKSIIGLAALPFIFIVLLVTVCLLKALKSEVV